MTALMTNKDLGFLTNAALAPQGFYTLKSFQAIAKFFVQGYPCFLPFMQRLEQLGWIDPDTTSILGGNNGYVDVPQFIRHDEYGMSLSFGSTHIPASVYKDPNTGLVYALLTSKVMPEAPTADNYLMLPIVPIMGDNNYRNTPIYVGASFSSGVSTNPLIPAPTAEIMFKMGSYFKPTEDSTEHLRAVQTMLAELGAGQMPSGLAKPVVIPKKTMEVPPGLYHIRSIEDVSGDSPSYAGTIQQIADWNDLGIPLNSDITLRDFLNGHDGLIIHSVKVNAVLPNKDSQLAAAMYNLSYPVAGTGNKFIVISPLISKTTGKIQYPYANCKGIDMDLGLPLRMLIDQAGIDITPAIMSDAVLSDPRFVRNPWGAPEGTLIAPPTMAVMPAGFPAGLPTAAPVALPSAAPAVVDVASVPVPVSPVVPVTSVPVVPVVPQPSVPTPEQQAAAEPVLPFPADMVVSPTPAVPAVPLAASPVLDGSLPPTPTAALTEEQKASFTQPVVATPVLPTVPAPAATPSAVPTVSTTTKAKKAAPVAAVNL